LKKHEVNIQGFHEEIIFM